MARRADGDPGIFVRFFRRPPQQSRSRALVEAIVQAFEAQLEESPNPDEASIASLIKRAGVGAGSFYEYFTSRDSVVGALIGTLTKRNFEQLLATVDAAPDATLEEKVDIMAGATARAYLARPRVTRAAITGIARLGLHGAIVRERDRFAHELAERVAREVPDRETREVAMRAVCDAAMGVVIAELERDERPDVEVTARTMSKLALAMLR